MTRLKCKLVSVYIEIVLILMQDSCTVCTKHTIRSETVWTHPIVPLGDEAQVQACFGLLRDSASLDARYVHGLRRMYHRLGNYFRRT